MKTTRIFGVEIELGVNLQQTKRVVHRDIGLGRIQREEWKRTGVHPYGSFEILPGWKYVYDGSCGAEIVSPPLNDAWSIIEMCNRIQESKIDYHLNKCGLHVHVQAIDYTPEDVLSLSRFCRHFNRTIYSFMAKSRFKDQYCRPNFTNDAALKATADGMGWAETDNARYRGLNIRAMGAHGTIEFRYSEGTDKHERICALVDLYTSMMDWCKDNHDKVKSPKGVAAKRKYLLDLIGVSSRNQAQLLSTEF